MERRRLTQRGAAPARRAAAPIALAARRAVARPAAVLLTAGGIAVATTALTALLVGQVVVEDRAVADAIGRLPVDQRTVSVSWAGAGTAGWRTLDRDARAALESLSIGDPLRSVAFRSIRFGTEVVRLAAVERPERLVNVRSGRLPARCGASRCELVAVDSSGAALAAPGFDVVGSSIGVAGAPLDVLVGSPSASERVLLAAGIEELSRRPELGDLFRTFTWAVPLDTRTLDSGSVDTLPRRIAEIDSALRRRSGGFAVRAPLDDLAAAREHAVRASRRQLIVAGQFVAVFVTFAVLAASRLRRSAQETQFRLRRLRALRWQVALDSVAHAAAVAVPAVLVGCVAGFATGGVAAVAADRSARDAVARAAASPATASSIALLTLTAIAVLLVSASATTLRVRGRGFTSLDIAAGAALAAVAAALVFGETDAELLARDDRTGGALLLLPILVALAGALLAARALAPALRLAERAAPAGASARLALLSLVRDPGTALVAVASLAVTTGMGVFALSYAATLAANQRDAAAYAAPLDYVVAADRARALSVGQKGDLAPHYGPAAVGVIRRGGEAPTLNRRSELTALGVAPDALEDIHWRDDYSERSPAELARVIAFPGGRLHGIAIPRDAEELLVPLTVHGDAIRISAHVRRSDGGFTELVLTGPGRDGLVRAPLDETLRGGMLVAFTLAFPPIESFTAAHRATGSRGAPDVFRRGVLTLGRPRARTPGAVAPLSVDYREWVSGDRATTGGARAEVRLRYLLTQERPFRIRPKQVTDAQPVPVIASTSIADAAGSARILPVRIGAADLYVRIAATARRFPTLSGDFLVGDREALATAANASAPGSAVADEAWLTGGAGREVELGRRAPVPVVVTSRGAIESSLRSDPVARAASMTLLTAALVAAFLALVGVALAVSVDTRDGAAELFDLETLGFEPARLARHVWLRSAFVLAAGLLGGLVTGIAASLLVTEVVAVTANATTPEPPLVAVLGWTQLAAGLVGFCVVALASVALLARRSFRGATAARPETA